eukprot:Cvel_21127.t1-p1 / transcript=Cvel_21127.t1 / gene=Cvel_21127 / organism=Chromera_velia_CCMP2878 / gene_product=hypothetical protein / transcript_product=hypothetical protein / location=Cvel_scaffold1957:1-781(-) / protein_length=260 / sequence_SO=supercontig / SO=protein_coding / is_pseudo=false
MHSHPYRNYSGIFPYLAFFNEEKECGVGALVPWGNSLWAITYPPHKPNGSSDKLYQIYPNMSMIARPESVGGTHANRFIHRETQQLFVGPYVISKEGDVRLVDTQKLVGRLTGTARHLSVPSRFVYFATMEEGFYEVDVSSLEVTQLFEDANVNRTRYGKKASIAGDLLPGYHGKGLYSAQGVMVYSNNGEASKEAQRDPDTPSGCLAEWDGVKRPEEQRGGWRVVRRNQFTEVTGPGGLEGVSGSGGGGRGPVGGWGGA